jgi:hypothetical protein
LWAFRSWRVLSDFYRQHSQFLLWPAERETIFMWKKYIICLAEIVTTFFLKQYKYFGFFSIWAGMQRPSRKFFNLFRNKHSSFPDLFQTYYYPGLQKYRPTLFYKFAPNTCGFSERIILRVNFPMGRTLMCLLYIHKICRSPIYTT